MRKDNIKKQKKQVKQKNKIGAKEKFAGLLFENIINTLLDKYEPFRETKSFEDFCRELVNMSNQKIKGKVNAEDNVDDDISNIENTTSNCQDNDAE